jgi:hypothetical protein
MQEIKTYVATFPFCTDEKLKDDYIKYILKLVTELCNKMVLTPSVNPMEYAVNEKLEVEPYNLGKALLEYVTINFIDSDDDAKANAISAYGKLVEAVADKDVPEYTKQEHIKDVAKMLSDKSTKVKIAAIGAYKSIVEKTGLFDDKVINKINQMTQDPVDFVAGVARGFDMWFKKEYGDSVLT